MTERLLGTTLWSADDDDRDRTFLLSDLHIPGDGGAVVEKLQGVLDAAMASAPRARVCLLGDLFDSYVGPAQLQVGVWRDVAQRLAAAAQEGVSVWCLHGNRDFLLAAEFERAAGCRLVAGGLWCRLAGRRALLLHGDELCQNDLPYQRAKKWLRSAPVKALARALPLRSGLWVAERARRRSMRVIAGGDQTRFDPTAAAVRAAFDLGAEVLVFGHIHRPARGRFAGGEYCVLPAFDAEGVLLVQDAGHLGFARVAGAAVAAVADPPPRDFA